MSLKPEDKEILMNYAFIGIPFHSMSEEESSEIVLEYVEYLAEFKAPDDHKNLLLSIPIQMLVNHYNGNKEKNADRRAMFFERGFTDHLKKKFPERVVEIEKLLRVEKKEENPPEPNQG